MCCHKHVGSLEPHDGRGLGVCPVYLQKCDLRKGVLWPQMPLQTPAWGKRPHEALAASRCWTSPCPLSPNNHPWPQPKCQQALGALSANRLATKNHSWFHSFTSPSLWFPLERVGMDLLGQLSKSAWGHKYILIIINYATQDPKSASLYKAMFQNIT